MEIGQAVWPEVLWCCRNRLLFANGTGRPPCPARPGSSRGSAPLARAPEASYLLSIPHWERSGRLGPKPPWSRAPRAANRRGGPQPEGVFHERLLADLHDPDSFVAKSAELADIYFKPPYELDKRMRFFIDSTRVFVGAKARRPALSDPNFLNILAFGDNELLRDLGAVVQEYQHLAVRRLRALRRLEIGATAALLALLALVGVCLLRPMRATRRRTMESPSPAPPKRRT